MIFNFVMLMSDSIFLFAQHILSIAMIWAVQKWKILAFVSIDIKGAAYENWNGL